MAPTLPLDELIIKLYDVDGLKFGNFTMRTGELSPLYVDMRVIWSYPDIVKAVCEHMWELIKKEPSGYSICGLPYQGIPLASYLSVEHSIPMILKRKSEKKYGTKRLFEGHYKSGDDVVLVDDVLMTGGTIVEDIPSFQNEGLNVTSIVCFFDRAQGGNERVKHIHGMDIQSVVNLPKAFEYLQKAGKLNESTITKLMDYLRDNRFDTPEYGVCEKSCKNGNRENGKEHP